MRIKFEIKDDLCVLRLRGRFATGSNAEYLQTRDELQKTGCRKMIVDCSEALYLDSTGIAFVVELYKGLRDSGGHFVLAGVNSRIRDVLELMQLDEIIPIFDDEQTALAALDNPDLPYRQAAAV
jgi:anti-anti-sigma factor